MKAKIPSTRAAIRRGGRPPGGSGLGTGPRPEQDRGDRGRATAAGVGPWQVAVQELTRLRDQKQTELQGRQEQLAALQKQYNDGRLTLAEDRLAEMEKQLEDMTIGLQRSQDDANREMQKVQAERFGEIEQAVLPIIAQVGREFGYTAIFNKFQGGLLYSADAADITNLIIERYNAAHPATPGE